MSDTEQHPLIRSDSQRSAFNPTNKWSGIILLFIVFLERLSFYSLTSNLFLFLNQRSFNWSSDNSITVLYTFLIITYSSCIIGGFIADTGIQKFCTIQIGLLLFSVPYLILPFVYKYQGFFSCTNKDYNHSFYYNETIVEKRMEDEKCSTVLQCLIYIAAVGSGFVRTNVVPFGFEQVRYKGPEFIRTYINWYYWSVNLGGFLAVFVIVYVQQNVDFFSGYLIPAAVITFAHVLFLSSRVLYTFPSKSGNMYIRIYHIIKEAYKSRKRFRDALSHSSVAELPQASPMCLDFAKVQYGGKFHESAVEDVKSLYTIGIVFLFLIPYWILYFQIQTTFLLQGLHMNLQFNTSESDCCNNNSKVYLEYLKGDSPKDNNFKIPAPWLTLFDATFLVLFIPLMIKVIYPWCCQKGYYLPLLSQMTIGMFIASLSMFTAGCVEYFRISSVHENHICQSIENTCYIASHMPVWYQIPQNLLMGISELFTSVAGIDFAFSQAPTSMQGFIMGLFYFCMGLGSFIAMLIVRAFNIDQFNLNEKSQLHYLFITLGFIQIFSMILFCFISNCLRIRRTPGQHSRILRVSH